MKNVRRQNFSRVGAWTLLVCLMLCIVAINVNAETLQPAYDPSPAAYVAAKNANSVVGILTYADTWDRRGGTLSQNISQGSGVVIRDGGYILTNNHVIEEGTSYQVLMPSGEKVEALLIGTDSSLDLAVLKVDDNLAKELVAVTPGSSSQLSVGSTVVAIGNPGGEVLANTVTQGIVSALERNNVSAEQNALRSVAYIQHDAAINSGNSGGGLFNYKGELVGINTLKMSGSAYSSITFEGLGFAIPVETVIDVASDLIQYGKVIRPALGVQVNTYEGPEEPLGNYPPASVCIYTATPGGAAANAGLKDYDFIYAINGVRVTSLIELTAQLDLHQPGDTVEVTVIRYRNATPVMQNSYNYGYGSSSTSTMTGEIRVSGGYEKITVSVVLEELQ